MRSSIMPRLPITDISGVLQKSALDCEYLRGKRIFVTGGTGFIGSWLLECLSHANREMNLRLNISVLSRDPINFSSRFPHLGSDPAILKVKGDVRDLQHSGERFDLVVHAATDASAQLNSENPLLMADTIVDGTRRVLDFAKSSGARRVLMISSGAVYGKLMIDVTHAPEDYCGGPDPLNPYYTYSESKRMAELLCALYAHQFKLEIPVARLFAFVGPRLPLDAHFAIGNFIRDGLAGGPIRAMGDGTAVRSYLYASDLIVWLLAILARGRSGVAYNVGSDQGVSMRELATIVADASPVRPDIDIVGRPDASNPVNHYVPDISRARSELGLDVFIPLKESVERTFAWLRNGVQ